MIQQQQSLVLSPYAALYDIVVPKDNMLRQINELVDKDPVIDPSSLTKFRKLRLKDINLLDMLIGKTV
ncbi:hypothetical protein J2T17_007357, partial [Paenibacillus mucilaginosus]